METYLVFCLFVFFSKMVVLPFPEEEMEEEEIKGGGNEFNPSCLSRFSVFLPTFS